MIPEYSSFTVAFAVVICFTPGTVSCCRVSWYAVVSGGASCVAHSLLGQALTQGFKIKCHIT